MPKAHDPGKFRFPALDALTRHFTVGAPRTLRVAPNGTSVFFLRSKSAHDNVLSLWVIEQSSDGTVEHLIVDATELLAGTEESIPEVERQRRERMREASAGITDYDLDGAGSRAVFALSGLLYVVELFQEGAFRRIGPDDGVLDPRIDPTGKRIAYVCANTLRVITVDNEEVVTVATAPTNGTVGLANFVAAEEFERQRGHWWSPDGTALAYEMADNSELETVWIFDPKTPTNTPESRRYPKAGTANPDIKLAIWHVSGETVSAQWERSAFEYLVTVSWPAGLGPLVTLMSRDQRDQLVAFVSESTGALVPMLASHDDDFLEWTTGLPTVTPDGRVLVAVADRETDTYRVGIVTEGAVLPVTPVGLQISAVVGVNDASLLAVASIDATTTVTARLDFDGTSEIAGSPSSITKALDGKPGGTIVSFLAEISETGTAFVIVTPGSEPVIVPSFALSPESASPPVSPKVRLLCAGVNELAVAVLLPSSITADTHGLPIIMSPYGGPHHQRVVGAGQAFALDQWIADQGYCVVVVDGRGTGGRGPTWDRSVCGHLGSLAVRDQVDALGAVVAELGDLVDPGRVGIRGWSFGGYLAARCVLERPDIFHAAVAGAPVTDFEWYDTGYTERYLGNPDHHGTAYLEANLLPLANRLERPLLFIHGFNDDNVLFAHTQMLSDALLCAGKAHRIVALSGVTHMPSNPVIAENIAQMQIDFFDEVLSSGARAATHSRTDGVVS